MAISSNICIVLPLIVVLSVSSFHVTQATRLLMETSPTEVPMASLPLPTTNTAQLPMSTEPASPPKPATDQLPPLHTSRLPALPLPLTTDTLLHPKSKLLHKIHFRKPRFHKLRPLPKPRLPTMPLPKVPIPTLKMPLPLNSTRIPLSKLPIPTDPKALLPQPNFPITRVPKLRSPAGPMGPLLLPNLPITPPPKEPSSTDSYTAPVAPTLSAAHLIPSIAKVPIHLPPSSN